jgi:integrase
VASIRKLPSGRYRVRWRDHEGNEKGATVPTKRLADQLRAKVELEAAGGIVRDPRAGRRQLASYVNDVLDTSTELRPATRALYESVARRYVIPEVGSKPIAAIEAGDLRHLYANLRRKGVGVPTIEAVHRLTSRVLSRAVDDGLIASNPAARARAPRATRKPIRVLTLEEVFPLAWVLQLSGEFAGRGETQDLHWRMFREETYPLVVAPLRDDAERLQRFAHLPGSVEGYGTLVLLALFSGLRFEELAGLRCSRVKLGESPRVEVVEALTEVGGRLEFGPTKTKGSRRAVPLPHLIADIMRLHVEGRVPQRVKLNREPHRRPPKPVAPQNDDPDPLVFTTKLGYPLSRTRFRARLWEPAASRLGFDPVPTFHHLRHSYAAWQIAQEAHPKELQELMGHTSIRTTMDLYGHLFETLESQRYERMNAALRTPRGTQVARTPPAKRA